MIIISLSFRAKAASFSVFSLILVAISYCDCRLCFNFKSFFLQTIHISGHNDLDNDALAEGKLTLVVLVTLAAFTFVAIFAHFPFH